MKTPLPAILLATAVFLPWTQAEEAKHPPVNPALLYWQAAALFPKLTEEQAAEVREIATGKKAVDAAKWDKSEAGERLLRKAAFSTAPCDWGLAFEDGPATVMPHLSKLREMANLAVVKAEVKFAEGQTADGLDWLLTAHRIARHASAGDTLISFLVQAVIENTALAAAGRHCLGWDEPTRRGYAEQLKALPPLRSLAESYRGEIIFVDWIERLVKAGGPQIEDQLKELFGAAATGNDDKEVEKTAIRALTTPELFVREIEAMRSFHRRAETAFGKSWKDSQPEIEALQQEIEHSKFILIKLAMPATVPVRQKAAALATTRSMLDAALQYGAAIDEAKVATFQDAFEGQPLSLKKEQDGSLRILAAHKYSGGKDIDLRLGK